jgi:exopolyphosphatase/guanosine-5'-triphosphate,3'-diphosphate pyrophosphatase
MRSAENGKDICERLASELNVDVRLLSGNEEAYFLKYLNTKKIADLNNYLSIDIGGGSTELHIKHGDEEYLQSVDLGAVRLLQQKDLKEEWDKLDDFLNKIGYLKAEALIGIGGNIRSLLEISGKDKFTSLSYEEFITLQKKLKNNSLEDRKRLFNLGDHRADVIVPATKIIERILNKTGIKDLYALNWSLCDAIAFDYYLKNEEAFI